MSRSHLLARLVLLTGAALFSVDSQAVDFELSAGQPRLIASVDRMPDNFNFILATNRSYCVSIQAEQSISARFDTVAGNGALAVTDRGKDDPLLARSALVSAEGARKCFLAPINTALVGEQISVGLEGSGILSNVNVFLEETSLYGGYNTSVTDFNFLEISAFGNKISGSTEASTINLSIIVRDVVNNTTFQVARTIVTDLLSGSGRIDVNIHELVDNKSFGPIVINHNGPAGSISARVVQYNITATNPLDFEPILEQQFVLRGARP